MPDPNIESTRRILAELRSGALEPTSFEVLLGVLADVLANLAEHDIRAVRKRFMAELGDSAEGAEVLNLIDGQLALRELEIR